MGELAKSGRAIARRSAATLGILLAWTASAGSQTIREDYPLPNGLVHALAEASGTLYVGGSFTRIGPRSFFGAALSPATGEIVHLPRLDGWVSDAAPDGQGGWFIIGGFNTVDGLPRRGMAHIRADGSVAAWNPERGPNLLALTVGGSSVYVGGHFTVMNGVTRIKAAALDPVTGGLLPWDPHIEYVTSNNVETITVAGGRVYLGGDFYIGGQSRRNVAAVHPTTGALFPWNPIVNGPVFAIAVGDSAVYLGGRFTNVDGAPRANLAAVDIVNGRVTSWNPGVVGDIWTLTRSGSTLYAGGAFTAVAGTPRSGLAAFDLSTGALTSWNPGAAPGLVRTLAVSGPTIYAGGSFGTVGGQSRDNIAAIDSASGLPTAWDPGAHDAVFTLVAEGGRVFAGGSFAVIAGEKRHNLAAIDVATGAITDWNPGTNGIVRALVAGEGPMVYAGGAFDTVGGKRRRQIAAIVSGTGVVTDWNPGAYGTVYSLALSGSLLYAGGNFTAIGGQPRSRIAALDLATGMATSWNPGADSTVRAIMPHGGVVFTGGSFQNIGGANRPCVAALDPVAGAATTWSSPVAGINPDVYALAARGATLYVGGDFSQLGGTPRLCMGALDTATGAATSWAPGGSATCYALALAGVRASGAPEIVYSGNGGGVQVLDGESGAHMSWYPAGFGPAYALEIDGPNIFAGGAFGLAAATELTTPTLVAMFAAETVAEGIVLRWRFGSESIGQAWVERADRLSGPWERPVLEELEEGGTYAALDRGVEPGRTYHYRLMADDGRRVVTLGEITATAGARYPQPELTQVGPVPSGGQTAIGFVLARDCHVRLRVFDVQGRVEAELVDAVLGSGIQQVVWNGEGPRGKSPAGNYFVRLEADGRSLVKRIVLAR